jgi:hypothetical protein
LKIPPKANAILIHAQVLSAQQLFVTVAEK